MAKLTGKPGFAPRPAGKTQAKRRADAVELIATLALSVSIIVVATAVSLGNRSLTRGDFGERSPAHASAPLVNGGK